MSRGIVLDPRTGRPVGAEEHVGVRWDLMRHIEQLAAHERREWIDRLHRIRAAGDPTAADGLFYHDTREPFLAADQPAVTLAATDKALHVAGVHPPLGGNYFARIGKKVRIRAFGKITTAATPGNGQFDIYWGTGADANGTIIGSSAALTLIAAQTNLSWELDIKVHARALGASGSLFVTGSCRFNAAVNAAGGGLIPASAAAAVAVDLTANNIISVQFKRSGSTVETMTLQDYEFEALN